MGCGLLKVVCEDGFEVVSKDNKELVAMTQMHVKSMHNRTVSEHEVLGMAKYP